MGYEIIYKTFTIKKDDVFIPMVVVGSNNCFEVRFNGRQRRERNLHIASFFFHNHKCNFKTLEDLEQHFDYRNIQKEMNGGMIQGKYRTAKGLINSFKKYIFNSDELKLDIKVSCNYYLKVPDTEKEKIRTATERQISKHDTVLTDKERQDITTEILSQIDNKDTLETLVKYGIDRLIYYPYHEHRIEQAFKEKYPVEKKKTKSTYEINQELKDQPFIEFKESDIDKIKNRLLLVYDNYKNLASGKGKIKDLNRGGYGFFKFRSSRQYLPLHYIKYYKVVN